MRLPAQAPRLNCNLAQWPCIPPNNLRSRRNRPAQPARTLRRRRDMPAHPRKNPAQLARLTSAGRRVARASCADGRAGGAELCASRVVALQVPLCSPLNLPKVSNHREHTVHREDHKPDTVAPYYYLLKFVHGAVIFQAARRVSSSVLAWRAACRAVRMVRPLAASW